MSKFTKEELATNFIQLYKDLISKMPHLSVHNFRCENSDYSDQLVDSKNAYVCFNGYGIEDCYYICDSRWNKNCAGNYIFDSKNVTEGYNIHKTEDGMYMTDSQMLKDCIDTDMTFKSELLYETIEDTDNYNCNFIYWCANCNDCEYVMYCFDCERCFGCFNLKWKKFHILNEEYEEKEYFELVEEIKKVLRKNNRYKNFLPDVA